MKAKDLKRFDNFLLMEDGKYKIFQCEECDPERPEKVIARQWSIDIINQRTHFATAEKILDEDDEVMAPLVI